MTDPEGVTLEIATVEDAPLLANLLQLYIHDLSEVFPSVEIAPDGRFGYTKLPLYWSEPDRRFPFLIRSDGRVAGFVLVTRGSPVTDDPDVYDIAEFFVLRRYRRSGVGRSAALALWERLPGRWTVRVYDKNRGAVPFWSSVIAEHTEGAASALGRPGALEGWRLFSFESQPGTADDESGSTTTDRAR